MEWGGVVCGEKEWGHGIERKGPKLELAPPVSSEFSLKTQLIREQGD